MDNNEKNLIIVLSRNYSTGLSVIRSLGAAGYKVDLIASAHKKGTSEIAAASKYVNHAVEVVSKKIKEEEDTVLINEILSYAGKSYEKILLFPTDDYTASVMDRNREKLKDYFLMPSLNNGGTLTEYMDKTAQSRVARKVGLYTPMEWAISLENENIIIPEEIIYPCYCKPIASILGYKTEMATCKNEEELKAVLYKLRERFAKRSVLVQEFLKIDHEIDMSGVCIDQEVFVPAVTKKNRIAQYAKGVVITGQLIPFEELGDARLKVIEFLKEFKYKGMFHMDLNIVGDKVYFGELNLRSGGPNYIYYASGVNLPAIFAKEMFGESHSHDEECVSEYGKTFVYEKVAWEEYLNGFMSKEDLDKCISESDVKLLYNSDDPVPEEIFKNKMEKAFKRKIQKDKCIDEVMKAMGWTKEYSEEQIREARVRLGITYNDYCKYEFYRIPTEEQDSRYQKILERRERIKHQREECILSAMDLAGWDRDKAEKNIRDARERMGISYNDYRKNNFCLIAVEEQDKKYQEILERRERIKHQREECILSAMDLTGWDRDKAEKEIKEARERLGITYNDYKKYQFALIPVEKQVEKYDALVKTSKGTKNCNKTTPNYIKPRVLVAGRTYSSNLCMARSLGEAGYEVESLRVFQKKPRRKSYMKRLKPDAYSKYVKAYHVCISYYRSERILKCLKEIADPKHKMLLVPVDDLVADIVDEYFEELSELYILPNINNKAGEIRRMMNKAIQKAAASKAGLPIVGSHVIKTYNGDFNIPQSVKYPCFIKPNISNNSFKTKMKKCCCRNELNEVLTIYAKQKNMEWLVEDYIEIKKEYSILGLSAKHDVIAPGFFVAEDGGQNEHRGVALTGRILPCSKQKELINNIIKFISSLNYEGLFDVDLIETVDGKMYFVELNLRYGGSGYAITASGINLPEMYADYMISGKAIDMQCELKQVGKTFVNEKILIDEYTRGRITLSKVAKCMKNTDIHFIKNVNDKKPYKHFRKFYLVAIIMRILYKIRAIGKVLSPYLRPLKHLILRYPQTKKKNNRNPDSEFPRVIVAGCNYCSNLSIARSLGEAGYEVEVLRIFQVRPKKSKLLKILKPDAYSKYVKAYYVCVSWRKSIRIIERLKRLADPDRKMLIIPTDDWIVSIIDKHYEELSKFYILPNIGDRGGEISRFMSKEVQKEMALKFGLPVINSCVIRTTDGRFTIPESITYPCFIKPNISKNSSKTKMRKCSNAEELDATITEFSEKKDIEMLVEDFVEIDREYSLMGLSTKTGVVGPGFFVTEESGQKESRGVALIGRVLDCSQYKPFIDKLIDFISTLNYDGLYNVDLIKTIDDNIYFSEINMRSGTSEYAITESGVNLPGMFADYMIKHKPIDLNCNVKSVGKSFINEKVMIDEYTKDRLSFSQVRKGMRNIDIHSIKNVQDMKPYRHFKKFYLIASIVKKIKNVKEQKEIENR